MLSKSRPLTEPHAVLHSSIDVDGSGCLTTTFPYHHHHPRVHPILPSTRIHQSIALLPEETVLCYFHLLVQCANGRARCSATSPTSVTDRTKTRGTPHRIVPQSIPKQTPSLVSRSRRQGCTSSFIPDRSFISRRHPVLRAATATSVPRIAAKATARAISFTCLRNTCASLLLAFLRVV